MKIINSSVRLIFVFVIILFCTNNAFSQDVENPEWGFVDFDASSYFYPANLSGSAIQAAIDDASSIGGGTVWIGAGTIELTENINMKSNVKLKGELNIDSSLAVTIIAKNQLNEGLIVARTDVKNTSVENLIIDGGGFDHHGLAYIYGPDNFLIANNRLFNFGVEKVNTDSLALETRADNPQGIVVWSDSDSRVAVGFTLASNHISSTAKHGMNTRYATRFIIMNNYVERGFMGYDVATACKQGEIVGNEVVDCIFGAKIVGYESEDIIVHHNKHHHLDDSPYYTKGWGWEYDSGTALVLQGSGSGIVVKNNILSGTTASKGIAYWDGGQNGATVADNDFTPSTLTAIIEVRQSNNMLNSIVLEQNYPNPFNPTTVINYAISTASHTSLVIYNTLGQEVSELVNKKMPAGKHQVYFDAANLPGGIYFCFLDSHNLRATKKMILLK